MVVEFEVSAPAAAIIDADDGAPAVDLVAAATLAATTQLREAMEKPAEDATSFAALLAEEATGDAVLEAAARAMAPQPRQLVPLLHCAIQLLLADSLGGAAPSGRLLGSGRG